jgi:AraC-like DNA-binding protein
MSYSGCNAGRQYGMDTQAIALLRAAINDRYGEGMADALQDCDSTHTQTEVAARFGIKRSALCRRLRRARTYARRLALAAGIEETMTFACTNVT